MKKSLLQLFCSVIALCCVNTMHAQITTTLDTETPSPISKGNWMVGGELNINDSDGNSPSYDPEIQISPTVGYFLANRFLVGSGIALTQSQFTGFSSEDFKTVTFQFTPLLRYYLGDKKVKPYLQVNGIFTRTKASGGAIPSPYTYSSSMVQGQFGLDFFLSKNAAFNLSLVGRIYDSEDRDYNIIREPDILLSNRLTLNAGMNFYLSSQKSVDATTPVIERYFGKGNRTLGVEGAVSFDPFVALGSVYSKKFINDRTRRNLLMEGFLGKQLYEDDFAGIFLFRPEFEHFIPLNERLFFAPSGAAALTVSVAGSETEFFVNAQFYPKLVYFTQKMILDVGLQVNTPFTQFSGDADSEDWNGSLVLGADYFLQDNLSLRGTFHINAFGYQQIGYSPFYDRLPDNVFRIGINYFIEK